VNSAGSGPKSIRLSNESAVPKPKTWASSWIATDRKSTWARLGPLAMSKFQLAPVSKAIDPPHIPKSVRDAAGVPKGNSPRLWIAVAKGRVAEEKLKPPGPPIPGVVPGMLRLPAKM